jgi:hypothetical protein
MTAIKRAVVVALLAVWSFPAVSFAKSEAQDPAPLPAAVTETTAARGGAAQSSGSAETAQLAAREKQAQDLQNYKGGEGVYVYVGSGVLLVLVIVLLLILF